MSILASKRTGGVTVTNKTATIRQILVITDGFSNVGEDPVLVASRARKSGVTVNVIGAVDSGEMGQKGQGEAMSIADAGGGMCRIVRPVELSATAQMLTHQTVQLTLQQIVSEQLHEVMGKDTTELPPSERSKVMQVVDRLEEEVTLSLVVCVDTSASMKDKMGMVREALRDLSLSLQARQGQSWVAILTFPGQGDDMVRTVSEFAPGVDMKQVEQVTAASGGTPTGPAIETAMGMFQAERMHGKNTDDEDGWRDRSGTSAG